MSRRLLDRLNVPPELRNTELWEPIAVEGLEPEARRRVERRVKAVKLYVDTPKKVKEIVALCNISHDEIRRHVIRCFTLDPDTGNVIGFRALLPRQRITGYTRRKATNKAVDGHKPGQHAGSFQALLARYPDVAEFIFKKSLGMKTNDGPPERRSAVTDIHTNVLSRLRQLGVTEAEYPFNTKSKGYDALRRHINGILDKHAKRFAETRLAERGQRIQPLPVAAHRKIIHRPFERVELDAYTQDCHLAVNIPTPEGFFITVPMERMSVVMVIERASRAALGYELAFGRNYNSDDVDLALTNAIVPWAPMQLTIPDLTYPVGSGLPSGIIPECAWRLWDLIAMDNAWAHTSLGTKQQLTETVRCAVNLGKVATPESRIIVERFFGTLSKQFHRLPSTTGSSAHDGRRTDSEGNAVKYGLTFEYLAQTFDVVVARYNMTPHGGLPGRATPLQYLREAIAQGDLCRQLFEENRSGFSLCRSKLPFTIRGNMKEGKRPYIQYKNAIYTNSIIADSPSLINKKVIGEINKRDARTMKIFLASGEYLGVVQAMGAWGVYKHSLRQRELLTKRSMLRHLAPDGFSEATNPMDALLKFLASKARKSKKAASQYAEVIYTIGAKAPSALSEKPVSRDNRRTSSTVSNKTRQEFSDADPLWHTLGGTIIE